MVRLKLLARPPSRGAPARRDAPRSARLSVEIKATRSPAPLTVLEAADRITSAAKGGTHAPAGPLREVVRVGTELVGAPPGEAAISAGAGPLGFASVPREAPHRPRARPPRAAPGAHQNRANNARNRRTQAHAPTLRGAPLITHHRSGPRQQHGLTYYSLRQMLAQN